MSYYKYIASCERDSITVIEDTDFPDCVGAYWGQLNTNIHKSFSIVGALTNGLMRDLGDLPSGFPVIAQSIGPSHSFVHIKELFDWFQFCRHFIDTLSGFVELYDLILLRPEFLIYKS